MEKPVDEAGQLQSVHHMSKSESAEIVEEKNVRVSPLMIDLYTPLKPNSYLTSFSRL